MVNIVSQILKAKLKNRIPSSASSSETATPKSFKRGPYKKRNKGVIVSPIAIE